MHNAACQVVALKLGCAPDGLRGWCDQSQRNAGARNGPTRGPKARIKDLVRDVRELRQVNELPKKATAYFALSRRLKPWGILSLATILEMEEYEDQLLRMIQKSPAI